LVCASALAAAMAPVALAGAPATARGAAAGVSGAAGASGTAVTTGTSGVASASAAADAARVNGAAGASGASGGFAGGGVLGNVGGGYVRADKAIEERYRPREVVVRYGSAHAASAGAVPRTRVLRVPKGRTVASYAAELRQRHGVLSATANYIAHASEWVPPDPGRGTTPFGWTKLQWNFLAPAGVDAPNAWQHLLNVGRPGGAGVTIAVVDTGIAYSNRGNFLRSPDFSPFRFVKGRDFIGDDSYPNDDNGHGTHVAGTIAEGTANNVGLTGLAYGAKLMPVKVLDRYGEGDSDQIAQGIRWAADHGAKIINLSFEFPSEITRSQIPNILDAIRHAKARGSLVVGASGNGAAPAVAYPARSDDVLSVGATTEHLCQADYSNEGPDLDLVAPGGGKDSDLKGDPNCRPNDLSGRDIYQMTFKSERRTRVFGIPRGFIGTSMAAPHVSATAALVVASGILGPDPAPDAIERRLETTARDLGPPGKDPHYGAGLLNAAAATDPAIPVT
jgi:serine protease